MAILHKNSNPQLSSSSHSSNDVSSDDWVKIRRSRAQHRAVAKAASAASAAKKKEQQIAKDEAINTDSPLPKTSHTQAETQHEGDASLQEQLARSSISKDDSNLISNNSATATEVPPATSVTEAQPAHFTAAEQKMVDTINSVRSKIDQIQFGVPTLKGQINNLSAKLCLLRWGQSLNKPIRVDAEKLIASHKSLYYNAGMIDESTLQQIFRLDSIQTDNNEIRKLRKAAVLVGNDLIKLSVSLRQRLERIKKSLDKLVAETATPMQDVVEEEADENSMKVDDAKESESESESDVEESDEKKEQQHSKPASPNHAASTAPSSPSRSPSASSPAAATAAPQSKLEKKYGHLNLPSYSGPQFQASVDHRSGALIIESDMSGIDSDDLIVRPEAESRTLSISGVKLPQRTRHIEAPFGGFFGLPMQQTRVAPHGFFTKRIDLASLDPHNVLDLSKLSAVVDSQNNLYITIPRKQTPPQAQRKVPYTQQCQQMEEEDDEDVDYFSHPFASYSRPQPQRYAAYAPYQRNPFFGARGFW